MTRGSQCRDGRPTVSLTSPAVASRSANCGLNRLRARVRARVRVRVRVGIRVRARAGVRARASGMELQLLPYTWPYLLPLSDPNYLLLTMARLRVGAPGLSLHVAAARAVAPPAAAQHTLARLRDRGLG